MTITVTTPTGHVGSRVLQLLRQAGARPRVLVRDPSRLAGTTGLDVRAGDLTDPSFVKDALAGSGTVFWADPTPHFSPDPIGTSLRTAAPLIDAAAAGEVERVVFLSSNGAERRTGVGHIDALGAIEERLDATGAEVLHLRCGYFFTNLEFELDSLANGLLPTAFDPDFAMPWVDPRDIGDVVAARLLNRDWSGRSAQGVHGPEDLSFRRVTELLSRALGREIRLATVSLDRVREELAAAGLAADTVEGIVGMTAGSNGSPSRPPRDAVTTTPTGLGEWAYATLRPRLAG